MEATETIVLYRSEDLSIIGEVYVGERYFIGNGVEVYIGTLEQFLIDNPQYNEENEFTDDIDSGSEYHNYEEL